MARPPAVPLVALPPRPSVQGLGFPASYWLMADSLRTLKQCVASNLSPTLLNPPPDLCTMRDFLHSSGTRPDPEQSVD